MSGSMSTYTQKLVNREVRNDSSCEDIWNFKEGNYYLAMIQNNANFANCISWVIIVDATFSNQCQAVCQLIFKIGQ